MNYNSGLIYNVSAYDGGSIYNSGPFTIVVLENGYGLDDIENILVDAYVNDSCIGQDAIALIANIEIADQSIQANDDIYIENNVDIEDNAVGLDFISSIIADLNILDYGTGQDFASIAGAFFVIDSNNYLQPLGVLVTRDSRYELLPATRDNTEEIPGRHGEIDFGTEFKPRNLNLEVATDEGYTKLEKAQLERLFAKYLDPTKGVKSLIFSDDVDKTYMVKYSGKIDPTRYASWFNFTLPFKMSNPFIVGSFEKVLVGSGTLVNDGTKETELTIEIQGPATNPSLTIGNDTLSYNGTINAGETLTIVTGGQGGMTAKIGSTNALDEYNGIFPTLPPGSLNVTADNNVAIKWHDKWL